MLCAEAVKSGHRKWLSLTATMEWNGDMGVQIAFGGEAGCMHLWSARLVPPHNPNQSEHLLAHSTLALAKSEPTPCLSSLHIIASTFSTPWLMSKPEDTALSQHETNHLTPVRVEGE